jgi:hypothetical protein
MVASVHDDMVTQGFLSPGPEPSDSDHVKLALQSARAFEAKGDLSEAARWLRHAADAAARDGNHLRQATLARAAADLTSVKKDPQERNSTKPPPPKAPGRSIPPPLPPDAHRRKGASVAPAPPALALACPPTTPPPPPRATSPTSPRTAAVPPPLPPGTPVPVGKSAAPGDVPVRVPEVAPAATLTAFTDANGLLDNRRAIRVSIKRSARDPSLLVVRRLSAEQPLPAGTSEALLVIAASDQDPFSRPGSDKKP